MLLTVDLGHQFVLVELCVEVSQSAGGVPSSHLT